LRQVLALREAIAILAQVPRGRRQAAVMNLKDLIHDRDNEVYGLLFQQGLTFFIRLRHADQNTLKAATERMVSALAPGPPSQLQEVVRATGSVDRISGRLNLKFLRPIELRTPLDDLAQNGIVHIVKSQRALFRLLAWQVPQRYLLYLTGLLVTLDLIYRLEFGLDIQIRNFSLGDWFSEFEARLSTAALGAYLVALFIRYGDIRNNLRGSSTYGQEQSGVRGAQLMEQPLNGGLPESQPISS
jgi:hypothetical protein